MYKVRVPEVGWVRENIAPWGSGRMEMSAARVTVYAELEPGKRLGVEVVEIEGIEEIDCAWVEKLVEEEGATYWVPGPFLAEGEVALLRDLTVAEAAKRLGIGISTMTLWCRQGRLPGAYQQETARGALWRIPEEALDSFERPKRGKPAHEAADADR